MVQQQQQRFGKPPIWNIFHDRMISTMKEAEIEMYKEKLATMVDQVSEESAELCIDRPRFVHAVVVVANETNPGELLKVSCIRQLDPVYEPVPPPADANCNGVLHSFKQNDYKEVNEYYDDDIEKALRRLQESRDSLDSKGNKCNGGTNANGSLPTSPQTPPRTNSLLEQKTRSLFNQFPSMNRKGLQMN